MKNTCDYSVGGPGQKALLSQGFLKLEPVPEGRDTLGTLGCLGWEEPRVRGREPERGRTSWRSVVGGGIGCWEGEQGGNSEREGCSRAHPRHLRHCWWSVGKKWAGEDMGQKRAGVSAFLSSCSFISTLPLCMISSNEDQGTLGSRELWAHRL